MLFDLHRGRVFSHAARLLDHWNLVPAHIGRGYRERGSDRTHQESSAEWCCQSADHRLVDADRTDGRVWRHAALRCDGPSHDVRGVLLKLSPVELSQGTAEGGEVDRETVFIDRGGAADRKTPFGLTRRPPASTSGETTSRTASRLVVAIRDGADSR